MTVVFIEKVVVLLIVMWIRIQTEFPLVVVQSGWAHASHFPANPEEYIQSRIISIQTRALATNTST